MTNDWHSLSLLATLMVLYRPIVISLVIAAIAEAVWIRTTAEQVPSLHRLAPSYLELVTSANFWSFVLIAALMLFVLLVMILLFSVCCCSVYESVGEILKFTIAVAHKIDVVSKSEVAY